MKQLLLEKLKSERQVPFELIVGYVDDELACIERLYDVRLAGDFRFFMSVAGRSSGGLIGDDPIVLYRPAWTVRAQLMFQLGFLESMQDLGVLSAMKAPFVFSLEAETQYHFLQTQSDDPDMVFRYDENEEAIHCTGLRFFEYMADVVREHPVGLAPVCRGELLRV